MTVTDPTGIDEIVTAARLLAPVLASNYEESEAGPPPTPN